MSPLSSYELAKTRIADRHSQARRDALAAPPAKPAARAPTSPGIPRPHTRPPSAACSPPSAPAPAHDPRPRATFADPTSPEGPS